MGFRTGIEWCDHTWNPWRGCTHDSPGCDHCYAEAGSMRNPAVLGEWGPDGVRAIGAERYWLLPFKWDKQSAEAGAQARVFSLSYGDWLEDRRDLDRPRARMLATIAQTRNLIYLLLTKRPQNFRPLLGRALAILKKLPGDPAEMVECWLRGHPPANVWAGASIEDRLRLERLPDLRLIPAHVHFVSAEPLIQGIGRIDLRGIEWVIIGGESGPGARPCDTSWIQWLVDQCLVAGVPAFVKQLGSNIEAPCGESYHPWDDFPGTPVLTPGVLRAGLNARIHLKHPKGGDPEEWPAPLRVREFPQ